MGKAARRSSSKSKKTIKKGTKAKSNRRRTKPANGENDDVVPEIDEYGKLYKSSRFKGYLTICMASIINLHAASSSSDPINVRSVPASSVQKAYAKVVCLVSAVITGLLVLIHLDRWFFRTFWKKYFGSSKSYVELGIDIFLVLWWFLAAIIQTSARGIAGDGREQYNLYYSTWICLWASVWVLERKMVDYDLPTIRGFVTSWPYRAPGWIAILFFSFFTLFWYVDLFVTTYNQRQELPDQLRVLWKDIPKSQYLWLLFVACSTLFPSAVFIFLEIVRESSDDVKGSLETVAEGFFLAMLTLGWVPSVIIVTTPGGFASQLGNAYFWTWGTTIFVMETFLWFIHDSRGNVQRAILQKEKEYKEHQKKVLQESQSKLGHHENHDDEHTSALESGLKSEFDESSHDSPGQFFNSSRGEEEITLQMQDQEPSDVDVNTEEYERHMKTKNRKEYFNSLEDILE
eukprot:scaffold3046_cov105-Cylindrotheca_fusiformis.AAC.20